MNEHLYKETCLYNMGKSLDEAKPIPLTYLRIKDYENYKFIPLAYGFTEFDVKVPHKCDYMFLLRGMNGMGFDTMNEINNKVKNSKSEGYASAKTYIYKYLKHDNRQNMEMNVYGYKFVYTTKNPMFEIFQEVWENIDSREYSMHGKYKEIYFKLRPIKEIVTLKKYDNRIEVFIG